MNKNKIFVGVIILLGVLAFMGFSMVSKKNSSANQAAKPATAEILEKLVRAHSPTKGSPEAAVTMVEFLDPECEACRALHPAVKQLLVEFPTQLRLVVRYMPFHGNSTYAAAALEEAREQGKFDQALDALFDRQPEWASHDRPRPDLIPEILKTIGMDAAKLAYDEIVPKHKWKVDMDYSDGQAVGVRFTPTFFINGEMITDIGYAPLKSAIEKALKN